MDEQLIMNSVRGAASWKKTACGLQPIRFTEKQMTIQKADENTHIRALASSGMRLAIQTDACSLTFCCKVFQASSKDLYGFDLVVNGQLQDHREGKVIGTGEVEMRFPLQAGNKTLELHFPPLAGVEILKVEARGYTFLSPVFRNGRMLVTGDSITQGYIAHYPSMTWPSRIASKLDMDLLNQGIGGDVFRPETLDEKLAMPDMVLVAYGTNDWNTKDGTRLIEDAKVYLKHLHDVFPKAKIKVLTPIWRPDLMKTVPSGMTFQAWRNTLAEMTQNYSQMEAIPGEDLFPPLSELFSDQEIHPSDLGFREFADRLLQRIQKRT